MAIKVKEVPVKAHNNIGEVEQYYMLLHCIYKIISLELKGVSKELILQIAVKVINDSTGPNRLIPILLVFGAYP